jgi:SAM-dependent methyltransferase
MSHIPYVGTELDLFAEATNWKKYLHSQMADSLGPAVLEVGAGFGGTTRQICRARHERWVCLEPDAELAGRISASIRDGLLPASCEAAIGTTAQLPPEPAFDTILYVDVLEHIEDDAAEVARAATLLRPGGHIVALSPAHPWLFTPFDKAIGHYRRYTKHTLACLTPSHGLKLVRMVYLDSVGLLASLGNMLLLKQSMPNRKQIAVWDKLMVSLSRFADPLLARSLGKSVLGIWRHVDE